MCDRRLQDVVVAVDVVSEIVIDRACAEVSAYVGDPSNAPQWYVNIESVVWRTPQPVAVGSRMDFVARFLGRRLAYTYEVVDLVAGQRLVMRTAQGPFPMETTYTWQPVDGGQTRMMLRNRGEPAGFAKVTAPVMAVAVRRANQKDLANLKRILERSS
jgi:polyketide cyclase/dehydrase/lipid transport protein